MSTRPRAEAAEDPVAVHSRKSFWRRVADLELGQSQLAESGEDKKDPSSLVLCYPQHTQDQALGSGMDARCKKAVQVGRGRVYDMSGTP